MERQRAQDSSRHFPLRRLRVPAGFVTAILFLVFSRPTWVSIAVGVPLALLGAALRAWASGHLRKNAELAVSGPYAFTRNPLYLGSFVMAGGCAVCGDDLWLGLLMVALFLAIYLPVMQGEVAHMRRLFGGDYARWAAMVPLFMPRMRPHDSGRRRRFDRALYLRHREYRVLTGLAVVIGLLSLKAACPTS